MRRTIPEGRGDWNIWLSIGVWFVATMGQMALAHWLVPGFPAWIILFYGLIYTPLISYVSGRMIGITGQGVGYPVSEGGYDHQERVHAVGHLVRADTDERPRRAGEFFREVELTGTKFTSIIKAEVLKFIVILPASFMFWSFFWKTSPIPSAQYPYVQKVWPVNATMSSIWWTANRGSIKDNWLLSALRWNVIGYSGIGTLALYAVSCACKIPLLFFYGFVSGIQGQPMATDPDVWRRPARASTISGSGSAKSDGASTRRSWLRGSAAERV